MAIGGLQRPIRARVMDLVKHFDLCSVGHGRILKIVPSAYISLAEVSCASCGNGAVCCLFSADTGLGSEERWAGSSAAKQNNRSVLGSDVLILKRRTGLGEQRGHRLVEICSWSTSG